MRRTSLLSVLVLLGACQSPNSGFLDGPLYRKLKPGQHEGTRIWIKEGADLRAYDHLLIEPVACMAKENAALTKDVEKRAAEEFHRILVEKVDPFYPVVKEPGEHVLRVRVALTELTPSEGDTGVGAAALEVDLRDSRTNEVLCAATSRIAGSDRGGKAEQKWQAAEGAFHEWADRLLTFMDSYHDDSRRD